MTEVVALLLDDAMPPERLGALLRAARKRRGFTRKHAAAAAGTTASKLRSYERGDQNVPADVCARLAECYGEDLTAHVPLRVPPTIATNEITIGEQSRPIGADADADDVLAGYVDIVHRLRDTAPGDPLALRTADIVALAGALGSDHAVIEQRIADVLGCSRVEAGRLHHELLRRKVILPVAGLAAGMAAFAGSAAVAQASSSASNIPDPGVVATSTSTTTSTTPSSRPARGARPKTAKPVAAPTTPASAPVPHTQTDATVPPSQQQAEVPVVTPPPEADPSDPPVSVLPGETPITIIIGTADSTESTP